MGSDIDIKPMKPCHIDRTRSLRNQAMSLSKGKPLPYPSPRRPGGGSVGGVRGWVRGRGPGGGSGASSGPRRLFNRPRAVQESFLPPTKASRSVPRCFQRASGGFMCSGRAPRPHLGSISASKRMPLHFKNARIL